MAPRCCVCRGVETPPQGDEEPNPLLVCSSKKCAVQVHKHCYRVTHVSKNFECDRCVPYCTVRFAKMRCILCQHRDSTDVFVPTSHDDQEYCHLLCALFTPGASFAASGRRVTISPQLRQSLGTQECEICAAMPPNSAARPDPMHGCCQPCRHDGCERLFHVTCCQRAQQIQPLYKVMEAQKTQDPFSLSPQSFQMYCKVHAPAVKPLQKPKQTKAKSAKGAKVDKQSTAKGKGVHQSSAVCSRSNGDGVVGNTAAATKATAKSKSQGKHSSTKMPSTNSSSTMLPDKPVGSVTAGHKHHKKKSAQSESSASAVPSSTKAQKKLSKQKPAYNSATSLPSAKIAKTEPQQPKAASKATKTSSMARSKQDKAEAGAVGGISEKVTRASNGTHDSIHDTGSSPHLHSQARSESKELRGKRTVANAASLSSLSSSEARSKAPSAARKLAHSRSSQQKSFLDSSSDEQGDDEEDCESDGSRSDDQFQSYEAFEEEFGEMMNAFREDALRVIATLHPKSKRLPLLQMDRKEEKKQDLIQRRDQLKAEIEALETLEQVIGTQPTEADMLSIPPPTSLDSKQAHSAHLYQTILSALGLAPGETQLVKQIADIMPALSDALL
eukprot:m.52600 g.52600  ORF g.52600 m.52600 type:complete len:613 (-) comp11319_c0_seq2:175-2013(-)